MTSKETALVVVGAIVGCCSWARDSGWSRDVPIYSWKRLMQLSRGNVQWV